MERIKDFLLGEKCCLASLFAAFTMLFTFAFIKDPRVFTISNIGALYHPAMFAVLCFLMAFAALVNMLRFFRRVGYDYKIVTVITFICCLAMCITAFTSSIGSETKAERIIHWTTALLYMSVNPLIVMSCGIYRIIKGNRKIIFTVVFFHSILLVILVIMLVSFARYGAQEGKNGIIEILPTGIFYLILFLGNNTRLFEKPLPADAVRKSKYHVTI